MPHFELDTGWQPIFRRRNEFKGGIKSSTWCTYKQGQGCPSFDGQITSRTHSRGRRPESFGRMVVRTILCGILLLVARVHHFSSGVNAAVVPGYPYAIEVDVLGRDSVAVSWSPPLSDGGAAVQSYEVEWDTAPGLRTVQSVSLAPRLGTNEVQTISTQATDIDEVQLIHLEATEVLEVQKVSVTDATSGSFMLKLDTTAVGGSSQTSGEIGHAASAEDIKGVLEAMYNVIGSVEVQVTVGASLREWDVTFSAEMGNVPTLEVSEYSALGPIPIADAFITPIQDGNVINGTFVLSFGEYETADIPHDASATEVQSALQAIPSIESVEVSQEGPDMQGGFDWYVTFTSPNQDGDVNTMGWNSSGLGGIGSTLNVATLVHGNLLSGSFEVSYDGGSETQITFDASVEDVRTALESLGTGALSVKLPSPPDPRGGRTWEISFIESIGDVPEFVVDGVGEDALDPLLKGDGATVSVAEQSKGTVQEIQLISTSAGDASSVSENTAFVLRFSGEETGPIRAYFPSGGGCSPTQREVQRIVTHTIDSTPSGGDAHVDYGLSFTVLMPNGNVTEPLFANGGPDANCPDTAIALQNAMEAAMGGISSIGVTTEVDGGDDETCSWSVTFSNLPGNVPQMQVAIVGAAESPGLTVTLEDDSISVTTVEDGAVDAIEHELELLSNIGDVQVRLLDPSGAAGCQWEVTFLTNAGDLPLMEVAEYSYTDASAQPGAFGSSAMSEDNDVVTVTSVQDGTSQPLGGIFSLDLSGSRTAYIPSDASGRDLKLALEALKGVGSVDVSRFGGNGIVNGGYIWEITFVTEFGGPLPTLLLDLAAITGTSPTGNVAVIQAGVSPPFDSSDAILGLPLGSTTVTDLSDLTLTLTGLEQGIPYYFRVSAANSVGYGFGALPSGGFAIPFPQPMPPPENATLISVDAKTVKVSFEAPLGPGLESEISAYRVEYSSLAFENEIQAVTLSCGVQEEVQTVTTSATVIPETQLIHLKMDEDFLAYDFSNNGPVNEQQTVECDATGGSFTLIFDDEETSPILWSASASEIEEALEQLVGIDDVVITFPPGVSPACDVSDGGRGWTVDFIDVVNWKGDMPLLFGEVHLLQGAKTVSVSETVKGYAPLSGSVRLTFAGHTTGEIGYGTLASNVQDELEQLDSIGIGNVLVTAPDALTDEILWRVTFIGVPGDVEAIQVLDYNNHLMGNGASAAVYVDGEETAEERRFVDPSNTGNQLSGYFSLDLLGHQTIPIPFNAADTTLKAALEELDNVGTVQVTRTGPDGQQGFSWAITFVDNPGAFPAGSGNVADLIVDGSDLGGIGASLSASTSTDASDRLNGGFRLSFFGEVTDELNYNAKAEELKIALEALTSVGFTDVTRVDYPDGYAWSVTFAHCSVDPVTGMDICNDGDIPILVPLTEYDGEATLTGCSGAGPSVSVSETVKGSAGSFIMLSDLSSSPPYEIDIGSLVAGERVYSRVSARHSLHGFGRHALTLPEFVVPSNVPPGPPDAAHLVSSTSSSIRVRWSPPSDTGGSPIAGYELWASEWTSIEGSMQLVYDGLGDPSTLEYTVTTSNYPQLAPGLSYQFSVRATSYCSSVDSSLRCLGEFSEAVTYTARNPRAPQPPPQPRRSSRTNMNGTPNTNDAEIYIRWSPPLDNGGSEITSYDVFIEDQSGSISTRSVSATLGAEEEVLAEGGLLDGHLYTFRIQSINAIGRSGSSTPVTVIAGLRPGMDNSLAHTYASFPPRVTDVSGNSISFEWSPPSDTGGTPITGYDIYMFLDPPLNTQALPSPIRHQVQKVQTVVDATQPEVQEVTIIRAASGTLLLRASSGANSLGGDFDGWTSTPVDIVTTSDVEVKSYIEAISGLLGSVDVQITSNIGSKTYSITFTDYVGDVLPLVVDATNLIPEESYTVSTSVSTVAHGTQPVRGRFSLSLDGGEHTTGLSYDATADEMKWALEDLDGIGLVSTSKTPGPDGTNEWFVTFVSDPGGIGLLEAHGGHLVGTTTGVEVSETVAGSLALLVHSTENPSDREFTATSLVEDQHYAFQVVPINAVGSGVPSAATPTIIAREGAAAAQTTASGPSLLAGIAGHIREQQVIVVSNGALGYMTLSIDEGVTESLPISVDSGSPATANEVAGALSIIGGGEGSVSVSRDVMGDGSTAYTITFNNLDGDVPMLALSSTTPSAGTLTVSEFVKGRTNSFTISPKKADGAPVTDIAAASPFATGSGVGSYDFAGGDIFFTEIWRVNADGETIWESDGGVATYRPVQLESQMLVVDGGVTAGTICLSWPLGTSGSDPCFTHDAPAADVKASLETGWGVSLDVEYDSASKTYTYTFTDRLGNLPLATPLVGGLTGGSALVLQRTIGSAEVQAITLSGDTTTVYERQSIQVTDADGLGSGNYYTLTLPGELGVVQLSSGATAGEIESAIESGLDSIVDVDVQVEVLSGASSSIFVTIIDPVGNVDAFVTDSSGLGPSGSASIVEVVKGRTSSDGTFTLSMNGEYTIDISSSASSGEVKGALESLSTVTSVDVTREDTGTGFRWWVTFTGDRGDLPLLEAYPYRWETQKVELMGGSPTPLGGTFTLSMFAGEDAESETTTTTAPLAYDSTASTVKAALESLSGLGRVDVSQLTGANGRSTILVTFRDVIGNVPLLVANYSGLTGSNAEVIVSEVIPGSDASLTGDNPRLTVAEMISGFPRYTATYTPVFTGLYEVSTYQLLSGGLRAAYFDNAWLMGTPSLERIDDRLSFDWGEGAITTYARDYVSVRWAGKLLSPSTEEFTLILRCDDGSRLIVDHALMIDAWDASGPGEYRATIALTFGVYHDLVVEYKEEVGAASIQLLWYSHSVAPSIIPSEALWYMSPIVGSPWLVNIIPGATSFPWTDANGDGLEFAVAGVPAEFIIQAKDSLGNNETYDITAADGRSFLVYLLGPSSIILGASTMGSIKYIGDGRYHISYTASKAGEYLLYIQTAEGVDIYCGKGQESKCSPFNVTVLPGPSMASMSEAQANYQAGWDSLSEGIAGQTGYFGIQLRDAYGNNAGSADYSGSDNSSQEEIGVFIVSTQGGPAYRGVAHYNGRGFYTIIYTVPLSGGYSLTATLGGEGMRLCTPPPSSSPQDRYYDGVSPYYPDVACSLGGAAHLSIIHGMVHVPSSTANVALASISGELQQLTIFSRDSFGNLRAGDSTSNLNGGGDGSSDVFFATFTGPHGHVVKSTSSVVEVTFDGGGWIRLSFADGAVLSRDLYIDLSTTTGDDIAAALLPIESFVTSIPPSTAGAITFRVTFLSHLDSYASASLHKLSVILPRLDHSESGSGSGSGTGTVTVLATGGSYPVDYTLWNKGTYSLDLKGAGRADFSDQHIEGSTFFISVSEATQTEAASSSLILPTEVDIKVGTQQTAIIHARDARSRDVQVVGALIPDIQPTIPETQMIDFTGSPGDEVTIGFLGQETTVTLGSTTVLQLESALNAFWGVGGGGWSGSVLVSGTIEGGGNVVIQFQGDQLSGNLPYLTTSGTTASAVVSKMVQGVGFLRREIQYLRCSPSAGSFDLVWHGLTASVSAGGTIEDAEAALINGWGVVVSISGIDNSAFCTDDLVFVTFKDEIGDVPPISSNPSNAIDLVGSLDGEAPYWGYLALSIDGGRTFTSQSIDAHSSAGDIEAVLEAFDGVEDVIVSRTLLDDAMVLWTITFEGLFGDTDVPSIVIDDSGIAWPSERSPPSFVSVPRIMGTVGNARDSGDVDLSDIDFEITDTATGSPSHGLMDIQSITCTVLDQPSADDATIKLTWPVQLDGSNIFESGTSPRVAFVNHDTSLPDLQTVLRQLTDDDGLEVSSSQLTSFCSTTGGGESVTVTFSTQLRYTQPLIGVSSSNISIVMVTAKEITSGIDDIRYLGDGTYEIHFTPVREGTYSISASIALDTIPVLDATVRVIPSFADAVRSSFTAPSLVTQGVAEYVTIQASDVYGNDLNGEAEGMFWLSLVGPTTTDNTTTTTSDVLAKSSFSPNTQGLYAAPVKLQASGKYTAFMRYHSPGGLLTTFFATTDFNDAVLANAAVTKLPFHDPPHCPEDGSMILGCDSTCTSPVISFNWGISSPHPELGLPADYFSVRFEGFVQAPISGPVTFTLLADDLARLVLRGEEIIMTANSTTTNSSGMAIVDMSEGDLVPVLLEMVEILDNATIVLLWMYDGLIAPTVIPSDALYYSRNLMGSPATIINVPGIPVAETSSITNAMDREYISCSATETCGVIIQSRDEAGNNVNNSGAHGGWIVSVEAIGGWALDGRVDEVVSGNPVSIDSTVVPMDWSGTSLGTVTCQLGSSVCVPWLDLGLDSGDEIVIGRERHVVAGFDTLALNTVEPFHEADGDYAVYLAGPLTGLYGATFTPTVVGDYALRVQMPQSSEVQVVRTSLDGVEGKIGGSFVVCESSLVGGTCSSDIPFDADATQFSTAIEEVFGIGSAIHTEVDGADCTVGCSWTVEFDAALGDVEDLVVDSSGLTGLGAKVDVEVIIPGMNQADIMGSPITVSVSPNSGSAARTTAYGKGLYSAIAGEVASFIVQVKDEAGNNRLGDEDSLAAYLVPPGNADYVKGHVEPLGEGSYNVSYTSNVSGDHTLAVYLSETSEIQQINLRMVEAGSFIISLGPGSADTTPSLAIDAPASSIAEALSALSYGAVNVTSSASQDVFTYTITFVDSVGDVPQSEVTLSAAAVENNPLATADSTTIVQGQASHIRTFSSPIISERQLLSVSASEAGSFTLSYRGRETPNIEIGASSGEVKAALESLDVIGSLTVDEISVDVYEGAYSILFQPEGASFSFGQWFTFGNIPELVVNSEEDTPEGFTSSVTSLVQGASPFAPVVHPAVRDPTGCMATQLEGVPDTEGLSKAQSGVLTTFSIESRDAFGNRIAEGPQKEIQIISIAAEGGGEIAGSFSMSALGNSVEIAANAPPLVAEAALESLPGVGGISVTAPPSSCSLPVAGVQATVQFGSTEVSLSGGDASSILRLGDWVRICGTGGVYAIEALSSTSLTLSSAYLGIDSTNCALLYNDRERFSFVIAFDTSLGDQPPLKVDSSNLYDSTSTVAPENIVKDVINCDWNRNQEIYVEVGTVTGGSFLLGYGEQFTSQIPFNATAEQLEAALLSGINVISAVRITSGFPVWGIEILALEPNIPLLPLTPESYLLEGSGIRLGQRQACPSAHGVVTAAGRVGANWLATLDGPGSSLFHFEHSAYGVYSSSYLGPPAGTYSLTVQEALGHGLWGTYWNNRWMYGDPAIERVDSIVDFS